MNMGERKSMEMCRLLRILGKHHHVVVFDLVVLHMTGTMWEGWEGLFFSFFLRKLHLSSRPNYKKEWATERVEWRTNPKTLVCKWISYVLSTESQDACADACCPYFCPATSIHLSIHSPIHPQIYPHIYLLIFHHLWTHPHSNPSIHLALHPSIHPLNSPSIHLSFH